MVLLNIMFKWFLQVIDREDAQPWENKALYILFADIIVDFIKLVVYVACVTARGSAPGPDAHRTHLPDSSRFC